MEGRVLLAAALLLLPGASIAMTAVDAQRALSGTWVGDGTVLHVDTLRMQVNLDPNKPFDWRPFRLADVSGRMVTFTAGTMTYVALFAGRTDLVLTSPSFEGEGHLHRAPTRDGPPPSR